MKNVAANAGPDGITRTTTPLRDVVEARDWVAAAKRTQSAGLIEHAEGELQAAVDAARDEQVQWGDIGSALGIARGNAYQRYRKRRALSEFPQGLRVLNALRNPSL